MAFSINKRIMPLAALALTAITAAAQGSISVTKAGESVDFEGNTGTRPSSVIATFQTDDIGEITFSGQTMSVSHGGGNTDFDVNEVSRVVVGGSIDKASIYYPPSIGLALNFQTDTDDTLDSDYAAGKQTDLFAASDTVEILFSGDGVSIQAGAANVTAENGQAVASPTVPTRYILSGEAAASAAPCFRLRGDVESMVELDGLRHSSEAGTSILTESTALTHIATAEGSLNAISGIQATAGELSVSGEGTLKIVVEAERVAAIRSTKDITVGGGTINIHNSGYAAQGIYSDSNVNISAGAVNIITLGDGNQADDNLGFDCAAAICAGAEGADEGGTVDITGGKIRIKTLGGTGASGIAAMHHISASNATILLSTFDDTMNAVDGITLKNCYMYATSQVDDAIDSNGSLAFRGGTIYVCGPYPNESAFDNDGKSFVIEKDSLTLIALGAKTDKPTAYKSTRPYINLTGVKAGRYVFVCDADGDNQLLVFRAPCYAGSHALLVSCPALEAETAYAVYTADKCDGGAECMGIVSGGKLVSPTLLSTVTSSSVK